MFGEGWSLLFTALFMPLNQPSSGPLVIFPLLCPSALSNCRPNSIPRSRSHFWPCSLALIAGTRASHPRYVDERARLRFTLERACLVSFRVRQRRMGDSMSRNERRRGVEEKRNVSFPSTKWQKMMEMMLVVIHTQRHRSKKRWLEETFAVVKDSFGRLNKPVETNLRLRGRNL